MLPLKILFHTIFSPFLQKNDQLIAIFLVKMSKTNIMEEKNFILRIF